MTFRLARPRRALALLGFLAAVAPGTPLRGQPAAPDTAAPANLLDAFARASRAIAAGDHAVVRRTLEAAQGVARDVYADTAFAAMRSGPAAVRFRALADRLKAAAAPRVRSDSAFAIADPDFIPEGIAYDPGQDAFFVGSLRHCGVLRDGARALERVHGGDARGTRDFTYPNGVAMAPDGRMPYVGMWRASPCSRCRAGCWAAPSA